MPSDELHRAATPDRPMACGLLGHTLAPGGKGKTSHNPNPVLKWSTQNHVKNVRRRPQLLLAGTAPY